MLKKIFTPMVIAQIISSMTVILCLLIDSIMIGRFLGVDAMAAYGLSNPLLLAFAAIGSMISAGVQMRCSKAIGRGDQDGINECFSVTVVIGVFVAVTGVFFVSIFRNSFSVLLGAGESGLLHDLTSDYLFGFILGAPAFLFATILVPYLQLSGRQIYLIGAVGLMIISDIAFDLLNVYVFHGGMFGMGIASSLSYYVACVVGLFYFLSKDCMYHFSIKLVNFKKCIRLLEAGIPTIINMLSLVLLTFALNQIIIHIKGSDGVAAYSIISTVSNICYAFSSGVAGVALMITGVLYNEGDRQSLRELLKISLHYAIVIDVVVTIVVLIAAPLLVRLFIDRSSELTAIQMAVSGTRLFALSLLPSSINTVIKHIYQGSNKIHLTEFISVLQNFLCIFLFSFLLGNLFGITGVWLGYLCGEILVLLLIISIIKLKKGKSKQWAEAVLLLPADFGVLDEDCFTYYLESISDISKASTETMNYCLSVGVSKNQAYYASLFVEEMCYQIIHYGASGRRIPSIDLRLFRKDGELSIRLRDDGKTFKLKEMAELTNMNEEDPTKHMGIRIIYSLAKDVNYTYSMSLNNLLIVL